MTTINIIYPDNPILRKKALKVRDFSPRLHRLIDDMVETMHESNGIGLAAPQVAESWRVIVVRLPDDEEWADEYGEQAGMLYEVVNPKIIRASRETVEGVEACLSVPGYFGVVERARSVVVRGQDRHGDEIRLKAHGWLARVFQHEIDHLDGVLYIDKASQIWSADELPPEDAPIGHLAGQAIDQSVTERRGGLEGDPPHDERRLASDTRRREEVT
jgi:peptide deformylase